VASGDKVSVLWEPSELRMIDSIGNREHAVATAVGDQVHRRTREEMIRRRACFMAQEQGFAPGQELHDWLWAEWKFDRQIAAQRPQHRNGMSQTFTGRLFGF
jgi:hypothetical protein